MVRNSHAGYAVPMPRRRRVHLDSVPLHIVQRGHNRAACFFAAADYHAYLHWLGAALSETDCALHAYVLMTNHVHLLVTPALASQVPKLVISLGRRYVQYVNKKYHRTGTLWDSRYKSSLVHADDYLLTCMRYIELNPVRAALVSDPVGYRWSSYRANASGKPDMLVRGHPAYTGLGRSHAARQAAYGSLFHAELEGDAISDIRRTLQQCQPLGDEHFRASIEGVAGCRCGARPRGRPRLSCASAEEA